MGLVSKPSCLFSMFLILQTQLSIRQVTTLLGMKRSNVTWFLAHSNKYWLSFCYFHVRGVLIFLFVLSFVPSCHRKYQTIKDRRDDKDDEILRSLPSLLD